MKEKRNKNYDKCEANLLSNKTRMNKNLMNSENVQKKNNIDNSNDTLHTVNAHNQ